MEKRKRSPADLPMDRTWGGSCLLFWRGSRKTPMWTLRESLHCFLGYLCGWFQ